MAFAESDRVQFRKYVGADALYLQADPRVERAITAIQAVTDGGTRPDNSTEVEAKAILAKLQAIDLAIDNMANFVGATHAEDDTQIDAAREQARLRQNGRMYAGRLAIMIGMEGVRKDVFSTQPIDNNPLMPGSHRANF